MTTRTIARKSARAKKVSVRPDIIGTRFHVKLLRLTSDLPENMQLLIE
jgi:hypothetical protein